jgi:hypothetical protein
MTTTYEVTCNNDDYFSVLIRTEKKWADHLRIGWKGQVFSRKQGMGATCTLPTLLGILAPDENEEWIQDYQTEKADELVRDMVWDMIEENEAGIDYGGLTEEDLQEVIVADMEPPPRFLDLAATRELALLEPCGTANPKPLFVTRNIRLLSARVMGKNRNVIRFGALDEKGVRLDLIRFEDAQEFERALDEKAGIGTFAGLQRGTGSVTISMIYYPDVNVWNGRESMQYVMNDFRVSGNQ